VTLNGNGGGGQFPFTDAGNGERFIARHGLDVRYVSTWRTWMVWDGARWRLDDLCEPERRALETVRAIHLEVDGYETADRKATFKHAVDSESAHRLDALLRRARSVGGIAVRPDDFDAQPMLFNCANGTVDLTMGQLRPHNRADLLTKRSAVSYDSAAGCPQWIKFLQRVLDQDEDVIGYLQRAMGYTLTGDTNAQVLHLLYGLGRNGKSTFLEVFAEVMGDYGMQADFSSFLDGKKGGPRDDLAALAGMRMVRSSEVGEGKVLDETLIKALTGQETVRARHLYAKAFEFKPTFKLWFSANHKPVIRGTDLAIWRRIRLVPFMVTIPLDDIDPNLGDKLRAELPGILNWVVAGALAWRRDGLKPPPIMQIVTEQYRTESDVMGAFLSECCDVGASYEVGASELYLAFKRWCERNKEWLPSQTHFGRRLDDRGFTVRRTSTHKIRRGLQLGPGAPRAEDQRSFYDRDKE
jgi:putative DNA primase/helicase